MKMRMRIWLVMCLVFGCLGLRVDALAQVQAPSPELASTTWVTNFTRLAGTWRETHPAGGIFFENQAFPSAGVDVPLGTKMSIGSDSFTVIVRCVVPDVSSTSGTPTRKGIAGLTPDSASYAGANAFSAWFSAGTLVATLRGNSSSDTRLLTVAKTTVDRWLGQMVDVAFVRDAAAGTLKAYFNGVELSGSESTGGSGASWTNAVNGSLVTVGRANNFGHFDALTRARIFNYAMSAAELQEVSYRGVSFKHQWSRFPRRIMNPDRNTWFLYSGAGTDWGAEGAMGSVSVDTANAELDVTANLANDGAKLQAAFINTNVLSEPMALVFQITNLTAGNVQAKWGSTSIGPTVANNRREWVEFTPTTGEDLKFVASEASTFSLRAPRLRSLRMSNGLDFLNGGFEGWSGTDAANWTETVAGSSTITPGTISPRSGLTNLTFNIDSSASLAQVSKTIHSQGKLYRLRLWAKISDAAGTNHLNIFFGSTATLAGEFSILTLTTDWAEYVVDYMSYDATLVVRSGTQTASKTIDIDDMQIEERAAVVDLHMNPGAGYQLEDFSNNNLDGLLTGTHGTHFRHIVPRRPGQLVWARTSAGFLGDSDRVILPSNARITSIVAQTTGTPTITVGTASGASADIVASVALSAGRTDLTLLKRFTSTDKIYVTSTTADKVTYTIDYVVGD